MNKNIIKTLKKIDSLSHSAGVYFFKDKNRRIIYIGKSANLKARVKSYFMKNALYGIKASMLPEIAKIDFKTTETEIDALILESQLIKKYKPRYNVILKDDKDYFYVVFTDDEFPKVFITHQPRIVKSSKYKVKSRIKEYQDNFQTVLGPYTDGQSLKSTLRYLRKIFPYCTCKTEHKISCLKSHLGLCLGACCARSTDNSQQTTNNENAKIYKNNIESIIDILSGKRKSILKKIKKEMKLEAEAQNFEKAKKNRDQIIGLENIFSHSNSLEILDENVRDKKGLQQSLKVIFGTEIARIEFYDISNIQGELAVGSMTVFDNGKIDKSSYRKFKIKTVLGANDFAMMKEVLDRRLKRVDWPMPDLIVVDGGLPQLGAAKEALREINFDKKICLAALAKKEERLFLPSENSFLLNELPRNVDKILKELRDEAHRFAISYHKKLRSKKLKEEFENIQKNTRI